MISELIRSLLQLLGSWWKVDRIRVVSTTGRLFQLVPGDRLLIGEQLLVVCKRSLLEHIPQASSGQSAALGIEYRLADASESIDRAGACQVNRPAPSADKQWQLQILLPTNRQPIVHRLCIGQAIEELLEEEIVVL